MEPRIYLKEYRDGKQVVFVVTETEIFEGRRYFNGFQSHSKNPEIWNDWDMAETTVNRRLRQGLMQRIQ